MSIVETSSPDDATRRVIAPDDSSDGIPAQADETADITLTPYPSRALASESSGVVAAMEVSEPTRVLALLTLGEIFAVLWALSEAAANAGIVVEVDPMPAARPIGVHLWCAEHAALCRWLARERDRDFATVPVEQVVDVENREAAYFMLKHLSDWLPDAPIISVGPKRFVHWVFRDTAAEGR